MYGSNIKFKIKLLEKSNHPLSKDFECGNEYIDYFLKNNALNENTNTKTYLIINKKKKKPNDKNHKKLLGFFSLTCSSIKYSPDDGKTTNSFSAIELKFFALDKTVQKLQYDKEIFDENDPFNFSDVIFGEIIKKCQNIKKYVLGAEYLILYSVPSSINFYRRQLLADFDKYMEKYNNIEVKDCYPMHFRLND